MGKDAKPAPGGNPHGNRSAVEMELTPEDRREFDRLLATGRLTLDAMVMWLEGKGYGISRSSVHRYKSRYDRTAARLRQSREMTQALATELGDAEAQGQQGRVLVEMARTFVFDMMNALPDDQNLDPQGIALLGKGLAELARAARLDQDFEAKVAEARAKATRSAATTAKTAAKAAGLTDDLARQIEAKILGVGS